MRAGPHVLVATDRNLYTMKLSGRRLLDVGEVVLKTPLDQADVYRGKKTLTFGGIKFHVMALFGEHADRLYDYVSSRAARPIKAGGRGCHGQSARAADPRRARRLGRRLSDLDSGDVRSGPTGFETRLQNRLLSSRLIGLNDAVSWSRR